MNRIENKFKELKRKKKKAFIAFITAGDPSLKVTEKLVESFEASGVDIVELGVPFSDPLADGPTIQASSERALKQKVDLDKIFASVKRIRRRSSMPIALMTYYNPVFHYGEKQFIAKAKTSGVDGVIVPDLPPEEAKSLIQSAAKKDMATIFFLSPTTTNTRARTIIKASSGFVYYVSLTGVTGARRQLPNSFVRHVRTIKRFSNKPVCVGFGISHARQVKSVGKVADGVIVGSAIINRILQNANKKGLVKNVSRYVAQLAKAL